MRRLPFVFLGVLIAFLPIFAMAADYELAVVPKPLSVEYGVGSLRFDGRLTIFAAGESERYTAELLNDYLQRELGLRLKVKRNGDARGIFISADANPTATAGAYRLQIDERGIHLSGDAAGLFYGVQTLRQILSGTRREQEIVLPFLSISDAPRFRYRGMHLDTARHFMPIEFVKKYIDLMSQYKFNYFHWHLTDDQGWRIEIKKYPRLTEIGSQRPETVKERNLSPYIGDGIPHGGFYTQEQIRDVVAYARKRFVTVVPEIEMPGHASAALAAYPELGCKKDYQYKVQTTWGIFREVFCPTDETFGFLENVLDEVMKLFPDSPYVHIGGDEVLKDHWKESEFVQQLKQREGLKDEHEVQSYFIRRIEKFVNSRGKRIIGWDEILEGGIAPNATIMSWRGMRGGIEAAKSGHDVIMTPTDYVYFDYGQGDPAYEPLNIGGYVPLAKVYSFDPVPPELTGAEAKFVIGGQANVWTEYLKTPQQVEYMAFPRMLALSEVLWSRKEDRDFADFQQRLYAQLPQLDKQNVNYRIVEPDGLQNVVTENEKVSITLKPAPGTVVVYTTDGSTPDTKTAARYNVPIEILLRQGEVKTLKTVVVNAAGRKSVVYAATIVRGQYREPVEAGETKPGIAVTILTGFEGGVLSESSRSILLEQFEKRTDIPRPVDILFSGFFLAPADGVYEFQIESAGVASLSLGGERITIDGKGTRTLRSMIVPLKKGLHPIDLSYSRFIGPNDRLRLRWGIKGQGLRQAYGGEFRH